MINGAGMQICDFELLVDYIFSTNGPVIMFERLLVIFFGLWAIAALIKFDVKTKTSGALMGSILAIFVTMIFGLFTGDPNRIIRIFTNLELALLLLLTARAIIYSNRLYNEVEDLRKLVRNHGLELPLKTEDIMTISISGKPRDDSAHKNNNHSPEKK